MTNLKLKWCILAWNTFRSSAYCSFLGGNLVTWSSKNSKCSKVPKCLNPCNLWSWLTKYLKKHVEVVKNFIKEKTQGVVCISYCRLLNCLWEKSFVHCRLLNCLCSWCSGVLFSSFGYDYFVCFFSRRYEISLVFRDCFLLLQAHWFWMITPRS